MGLIADQKTAAKTELAQVINLHIIDSGIGIDSLSAGNPAVAAFIADFLVDMGPTPEHRLLIKLLA